jgi:hypothetical protein
MIRMTINLVFGLVQLAHVDWKRRPTCIEGVRLYA